MDQGRPAAGGRSEIIHEGGSTMEQSPQSGNDRSRARLRQLIDRLDEEDWAQPLDDGWTVAVALAHLAFWDRWAIARWDQYERDGAIEWMPDVVNDLANAAALPQWLALAPRQVAELALAAAEAVDRRIEVLAPEAIAHAIATGRRVMVDRSLHRDPHLDEIERRFAGGG
jgi:hypothetical protein